MRGFFPVYLMFVLGSYGFATWNGWELFADKRGVIPQDVRQAPGGYRSYNYWRGGK